MLLVGRKVAWCACARARVCTCTRGHSGTRGWDTPECGMAAAGPGGPASEGVLGRWPLVCVHLGHVIVQGASMCKMYLGVHRWVRLPPSECPRCDCTCAFEKL